MVKPMHEQSPSVKLLTILNVQSAKPPRPPKTKKRSSPSSPSSSDELATSTATATATAQEDKVVKKQVITRDWHSIAKKANNNNKKVKLNPPTPTPTPSTATTTVESKVILPEEAETTDGGEDSFKIHFGSDKNRLLETTTVTADEDDDGIKWRKKRTVVKGLGECQLFTPATATATATEGETTTRDGGLELYSTKLLDKLRTSSSSSDDDHSTSELNWLSTLSSYRDLCFTQLKLGQPHESIRSSISLHCMNHVLKTRSRILKNNELLSKSTTSTSSSTLTDQGFTRPKVLILSPFRSSALSWVTNLLNYSLVPQFENYERFLSEFSLPLGVKDKLVENSKDYPEDHVETFKGNIDDSFRLGLKLNRKQVKLFSEFYQADIIVASPLGLRTSIEKDRQNEDSDYLSSIEIVIVDQMDVLLMQNWEHLNYCFERLNKIPEQDHGCDFSRVKPWYLDGKSQYLRQSILLSRYQTPETLSLFTNHLNNLAGKIKTLDSHHEGGIMEEIPRGLKQVWTRFEIPLNDPLKLSDERFKHFTEKTLPNLMKSAQISSQQTLIFVPDYFDFVRLKRYLSQKQDFSFSSISEYTPTPEVSRARGSFFSGKTKFLLITERFHFFRRYRIRGAKNFIFYAPPSHASYYSEFLKFPFTSPSNANNSGTLTFDPELQQLDESELSAHVLFSKFDLLKLERIVGTRDAKRMCNVGGGGRDGTSAKVESRFTFV